ncbi:MAG: hypothetical protein BZY75_00855 [SAR202 cluster bacterium Io17-Chloro-G7]|nr:MAG: hypothetical protein BZY75_00855 [SAR202 cluster bacterium Io17-Chloro-G7]
MLTFGGAMASGPALSRLGAHYRIQGLAGLGAMAAGLLLLSRMSAETAFSEAVGYIVVMEIGLGVIFPVYTLVVQNSVPHRVLGVVTTSVQFFRSVGGTLGLAILGSTVTSRFASELSSALPARVPARVKEVIPPEKLATIAQDPFASLNPAAKEQREGGLAIVAP